MQAPVLTHGKNWAHPYYDSMNTNFNPQTTVNKDNVGRLEVKWVCDFPRIEFRPRGEIRDQFYFGRLQTTPLVIDGSVFLADGGNTLYSVDGATGKIGWSFHADVSGLTYPPMIHSLNSEGGLIFFLASRGTLYALDPGTGEVKLRVEGVLDRSNGGPRPEDSTAPSFSAPSFYGSSAVIGSVTEDPKDARGFVARLDLKTGKPMWTWYVVPPATRGPKDWDRDAAKGNISAYPGDWGDIDLSGRGAVWGQTVSDEETGRVYVGTGNPWLFHIDGSLRPGPLLYTNSLVCLDAKTGEMLWYHQATPHDFLGWDFGASVILAEITTGGRRTKALVGASKNTYVYVADAMSGKLVHQPIKVGYSSTPLNANKGDDSDMRGSIPPGVYCPAHNGGVNAPPAFAYNTIFVATQRFEQRIEYYEGTHKGEPIRSIQMYDIEKPRYSTISAIDADRGEVRWSYFVPNGYQGAGLTVSGGVVYGVDRGGILYMLDASNGDLLRQEHLKGHGAAGASIGATRTGEMRLFVPMTAGDGLGNRLVCLGLRG